MGIAVTIIGDSLRNMLLWDTPMSMQTSQLAVPGVGGTVYYVTNGDQKHGLSSTFTRRVISGGKKQTKTIVNPTKKNRQPQANN